MFNDDDSYLNKSQLGFRIGQRIKQLRKMIHLSQAELARICHKDKQHIELIENNKVSANIYTLYIISQGLNVELRQLFDFDNLELKTNQEQKNGKA